MSQSEKSIRRANEILRELDSVYPGGDGVHSKFQLRWSEELWSLIPRYEILNGEPVPVMEYRCKCGIDKRVHRPDCDGLVIAKTRLDKVKTFGLEGEFPAYINVWVLCSYQPPPSKEEWIHSFGTDEDYPANGRYLPVHRGPHCVCVPRKATGDDFVDAARVMVRMMREHQATWKAEFKKQMDKRLGLQIPVEDVKGNVINEPDRDAAYWRVRDKVADRIARNMGKTGGMVGYTKEAEGVNAN